MKRLLAILVLLCAPCFGTTYYVATSGSDSNTSTQAQSKSTPWQHLPCMTSHPTYTPVAGDTFVLRGGDAWTNANFPCTWTWSGSSGSHIVVTVDQTWYSGASWNRPVFDAGGASIAAPDCTTTPNGLHWFVYFNTVQYVEMHWIEMKGLYWNNDQQSTCFESMGFIYNTQSDYLTIDNFYFHGWTHGTSAGTTDSSNLIAYTTYGTAPYCFNCSFQNNVVDNSDGDGATCGSGFASCSGGGPRNWGNVVNNVFSHMVSAVLTPIYQRPSTMTVSGNDISYLDKSFTTPTQSNPPHPNCIETTGVVSGSSSTAVLLVHDNHIHNIAVCEGMQVGNPNEDDYAWNNIFDLGATGVSGANGPQIPQGSSSGIFLFANNTVRWATGCLVAGGHGTSFTSFTVQNNHCINDTSTITSGSIPGQVISNNVGMTNATATSQGYTSAETYVFSPTAGSNSTVGAGTNLSSSCTGNLTSLCSDTTYAVSEQTIGGVVQVVTSGRTTNARGTAFDAGAYQYVSSGTVVTNSKFMGIIR